jgi:hypothetical protein
MFSTSLFRRRKRRFSFGYISILPLFEDRRNGFSPNYRFSAPICHFFGASANIATHGFFDLG